MDQLATLHRLDPSALDLPELGPPGALSGHVLDEIAEWEQQYAAAGGGVPVITLACAWLRANVPDDDGWPVVLVQGDTGPGNFMFDGDRLVAVTDWELAHWGDVHDDLAWVLVRDTLERFPDLETRFADYERASGVTIDAARLRYFRVLAQCRATIGTLAGLRSRDARGEIAWQLIYNTLHTRLLAEALAEAEGVALEPPLVTESGRRRAFVGVRRRARRPARRRAPGARRRLRRDAHQGRRPPPQVPPRSRPPRARFRHAGTRRARRAARTAGRRRRDRTTARCARRSSRERSRARAVLAYCLRQSARDTAIMRAAMGSLADRHFTPVRQLAGGGNDAVTDPRADDWGLLPEDDQFHPPETDDPWWTETVWFSWMVPERNLLGYFYPAFRANMGIQFGGVMVVDDTAVVPWELPAFEWSWHEPLTEAPDLLDTKNLHGGMWLRCLEPGRVFRFGCENDDLSFDLTFEALCRPLLTRQEPPFNHGAHIDQPGRVTGSFTLHGEAFEVDCITMRDRSWGVRRAGRQPKVGYDHGTASADDGFLSISVDRKGDDRIGLGYLLRDGVWSNLVDGHRTVERDAEHRPARIEIEAVDELGRALHATGRPVSRCVFNAYPHMFCWASLTRMGRRRHPLLGRGPGRLAPRQVAPLRPR